jgi:hypothetical protein
MTSTWLIRMRCIALGTVLLAFSVATVAYAAPGKKIGDDWYPPLKKGLWEIFNSSSQNAGYTTTELRCVGAAGEEKQTSKKEHMEETKDCRISILKTSAQKVEQQRVCKRDEGVIATIGVVYQGDFSSKFERKATLSLSIPARQEGATQLKRYRFVGRCPKGMLPGETMTVNAEGIVGEWDRYTGRIKPLESAVRLELRKQAAP